MPPSDDSMPSPAPGVPPPAASARIPTAVIVLILVGCLGVVGLASVFVFGVVVGFRNAMRQHAPTDRPSTLPLTQTYATPNGLLTAHYPAEFAAKTIGEGTLIVSKTFVGDEGEVVTLSAVGNPITDDLREFARVSEAASEKHVVSQGGKYTKTAESKSNCLAGHPGLRVEVSYQLASVEYAARSRYFFIKGRGLEVRYDVPRARAERETALLERIIEATELAR